MDEEACFGPMDNPASDSSNGFVKREGTVPALARRTFGELSVEGTSDIELVETWIAMLPSGIDGSTGVLLGELFELPIEFDQKMAGTPSCCWISRALTCQNRKRERHTS
jgi:hypothetical protein